MATLARSNVTVLPRQVSQDYNISAFAGGLHRTLINSIIKILSIHSELIII